MSKDPTTISVSNLSGHGPRRDVKEKLGLLIAWSASEPARIGEVALFDDGEKASLGRGAGDPGQRRATFVRQRPGANEETAPLGGLSMSRDQVHVRSVGGGLEIARVGRRPIACRGAEADRFTLAPGEAFEIKGQLVLLCVERPESLPPRVHLSDDALGPFGACDAIGLLGESPLAWRMRDRIAFAARSGEHVLVFGESGSGKELAASAIHRLSPRNGAPFVARNAATLPAGLIDAELFGNGKNYPHAGMPQRAGLVGEADGGTLFLDEIAELPPELQSHLLRVLDANGEYQRLGESTMRRSQFVLVGATNRDPTAIKHDLFARFAVRIELPNLRDRIDDVPLFVHHLLARAAKKSAGLVDRFLAHGDDGPHARVDPALVLHALERAYPGNVRDLDALLWRAMGESTGDVIVLPEGVRHAPPPRPGAEPDAESIKACLAENEGNVTRAAAALGLSSRYALYRLMRKAGIATRED